MVCEYSVLRVHIVLFIYVQSYLRACSAIYVHSVLFVCIECNLRVYIVFYEYHAIYELIFWNHLA